MQIARFLIITGSVFLAGGLLLWALAKCCISDKLGKLPGDLQFQGKNFTFYFPLATSILLSLILSLVSYFWSKWNR